MEYNEDKNEVILTESEKQYFEAKEKQQALLTKQKELETELNSLKRELTETDRLKNNLQKECYAEQFRDILKKVEANDFQEDMVTPECMIRICAYEAIKDYFKTHLRGELLYWYDHNDKIGEYIKTNAEALTQLEEAYFKSIQEKSRELQVTFKKWD